MLVTSVWLKVQKYTTSAMCGDNKCVLVVYRAGAMYCDVRYRCVIHTIQCTCHNRNRKLCIVLGGMGTDLYLYTTQQEDNNIVKSQIINDWGCGGGMGQPLKVHGI